MSQATKTTIEYRAWTSMRSRCFNRNHHKWKNYGGRGITICDRWLKSFESFASDMGQRPGPGYSLDRIDTNGNYEPGNCRWATAREQANNSRSNRVITWNGETLTLTEWARRLGRNAGTLWSQLKIHPPELVLAGLPLPQRKRKRWRWKGHPSKSGHTGICALKSRFSVIVYVGYFNTLEEAVEAKRAAMEAIGISDDHPPVVKQDGVALGRRGRKGKD